MLHFDSPPNDPPLRPTSLNLNNSLNQPQYCFNNNINNTNNNSSSTTMKHSKSDYDAFYTSLNEVAAVPQMAATNNFMFSLSTSHTIDNIQNVASRNDDHFLDPSDLFNTRNTKNLSYPSLYPHVEIVNNNQMNTRPSPPSSPTQQLQHTLFSQSLQGSSALAPNSYTSFSSFVAPPPAPPQQPPQRQLENINFNNNYNNNSSNINTSLGNAAASTTSKSFGPPNYSHALSKSLASTPGVTIMPLNSQLSSSTSNLFNYGFYNSNNDFNTTAQCKFEVSTKYTHTRTVVQINLFSLIC